MAVVIQYTLPKEVRVIEYDINITAPGKGGFNLDKDKLHFGKVCEGCASHRKITLENDRKYTVNIIFLVTSFDSLGAKFIYINPSSNVTLIPLEKEEFTIDAIVPENATLENHAGTIGISTYKKCSFNEKICSFFEKVYTRQE